MSVPCGGGVPWKEDSIPKLPDAPVMTYPYINEGSELWLQLHEAYL